MLPLVMIRPYEITYQGSIYTENAIEYNDLYLDLFNTHGGAIVGDFLLFCYYEVSDGDLGIVTVGVLLDSATVYAVAVFVIGDTIELLDSRSDSAAVENFSYMYSFEITKGETYGVAMFGHKEASNIDVEIGFTVVIQT